MEDHNKPESGEAAFASSDKQSDVSQKTADVWTSGPEVAQGTKTSKRSGKKLSQSDPNWEQDVLNRLAFASLNEQRRSRRWNIFFKSLLFIYLFALLFYVPIDWSTEKIRSGKHTALIDLEGVIAANAPANADSLATGLRAAFKDKNTVAVILRINSPGGSPVQSGYVYDEIKRLREKYPATKLYVVITDVCASGGYYIAAAADEIYADKASVVGSIGVLMNGFGFVDTMEKLGVERRLMTAGEHKGILDPFSPLKQGEKKHVQNMLDGVHQQFINSVKDGRGDRLSDSPDLFTGLFWNGEESLALGLIDGLGSSSYVAREIIGVERIVDFTPRPDFLEQFTDRIGVSMANILAASVGFQPGTLR